MKRSKIQSHVKNSLAALAMAAQASKSKFVPVLLISGTFLIINATLPVRAQEIAYNITLTFNEPMTQPGNSVFVGSFDYNASTHAVTDLQGLLSEAMTDQGSGENWLTLNNQLPNGNSSQQYQWQVNQFTPYAGTSSQNDDTTGGTFATVFLNNSSSTFATSYNGATGDGWSPAGGIAVNWKQAGYPNTSYANSPLNAYALIFEPNNLSGANAVDLTWNESAGTGSLGLSETAYADYTEGGKMSSVGMTGTSDWAYGSTGTMGGVPESEIISEVSSVPEPSTWSLAASATGLLGLLISRKKKS